MKRASEVRVKKPYHAPKLTVYGDLTQLTMTTPSGMGQFDNVKHNMRT
jgi:hypothetical protein